jgi:hypothetical protein
VLWTFEATRFWTGVEPKRGDTVTGDAADPAPATWITDSPEAESVSSAWVAGGGRDGEPLDLISLHVRRETVVLIVAADSLEDSRQADALCNDLYAAALDAGAAVHGAVIADEANIRLSYRDDGSVRVPRRSAPRRGP